MRRLLTHSQTLLIFSFVLFVFVRFINLPDVINFGSDAGRDFLATYTMFQEKQPTLIGPPSQYTINGREFFFGPAPYYLILPALLIGHWDPISVSYFLILLNGVVFVICLLIMNKFIKNKWLISLFALFSIVTPPLVSYTQSYWNPYLMLPTAMLLVALLVMSISLKKNPLWLYGALGILFGLGLQFHYAFILAIVVSIVILVIKKKNKFGGVLTLLVGFGIGFAPVLLFEVRNHFYNFSTLLLVFNKSNTPSEGFMWRYYYAIPLIPFLIFLISSLVTKYVRSTKVLVGFMIIYVVVSLYGILMLPKQTLTYPALKQIAAEIMKDKPHNFNIVDQLTSDNRAMALRYILTVNGRKPNDVTDYPGSKTLYVYSDKPLKDLIINPVWELQSFVPLHKVSIEKNDKIFLYTITK